MARITTLTSGSTEGTRLQAAPIPPQQLEAGGAAAARAGVAEQREDTRQSIVAADEISGVGDTLTGRVDALVQAEGRLNKRNDDLARARGENAARLRITDLTEAERTQGENFTTESSIQQYNTAVNAAIGEIMAEYQGQLKLPESSIIFMEQLEAIRGQAERDAIEAGLQGSEAELDENVSNFVSGLTSLVNASPASLDMAVDEVMAKIDRDYAGSVTPEKELATRQAAVQQLATAAVDRYVTLRDVDAARMVMSNRRIIDALDPGRQRELNLKIARLEGTVTTERAKGMNTYSIISQIDPTVPFTNQLAERASEIDIPLNPTPEEVIGAYRQLVGEPPPEVIQAAQERFTDTFRLSDINDSQLQGRLWLGRNATSFAQGNMSPQAEFDFIQTAARMVQENPLTGIKGELSPIVRDALRARGFDPDKLTGDQPDAMRQLQAGDISGLFSATQAPADRTEEQERAIMDSLGSAEQALAPAMHGSRTNPPQPNEDPEARPNSTLRRQHSNGIRFFQAVDLLSGPISGIKEFGFGIPFIGELIPEGSNIALYRQEFELFKVATVSALRRTERFADAERQYLIGVVLERLQSSIVQNPEEMAMALVGLDDAMAGEIAWAQETLADPNSLSRQTRAGVQDRMEQSQFIRSLIGAPPVISTTGEAAQAWQEGRIRAGQRLVVRSVNPVNQLPTFTLVTFTQSDVDRLEEILSGSAESSGSEGSE